jgi:RHS repeat-associated protein
MPTSRPLFFAMLALLIAPATLAQIPNATDTTATPAPGAHDYFHSPVETVNPANGSVSIRIPVRMPQGRQFTLPFSFAYDSNGAFYIGQLPNGSTPRYMAGPTVLGSEGGWSYTYPILSFFGGTWTIPGSNDHNITCHGSTNYVFQDPNGDRHNLGLSVSPNVASPDGYDNCNEGIQQDGEFTTGGEGPILATTSIPSGNTGTFPSVSLTDGNGTGYALPGGSPGTSALTTLATSVTDRNGNAVTLSNSSGAITYTDTIGRTALHTSGMGANPDTITVGGLSSPYHVYWTTASANFSLNMLNLEPGVDQTCPTSLSGSSTVISSVVLPDGRQFTLTYDSTYGMLTKIVYPSGGYVRYVWGLNPQAEAGQWAYTSNGIIYGWSCRYDFPAVSDRYVSYDGSNEVLHQHFAYYTDWSNNTTPNWNYKTTTVTTTDLVRNTSFTTVYTYSALNTAFVPNCGSCSLTDQIPVEQSIVYKDIGGATLKTVTKSWKNVRLLQSEETTLDNGQSSLKVYCYNTWEEATETDEFDLGTGTPSGACASVPSGSTSGPLLRKTATTYATFTPHIVNLPATVVTYDGSGNRVAETDSPSYDANGNLLTQTKDCFALPGGQGCSQGNSTTKYTYDSHGQILTMVDPRNNTTSYSYTDSYSGCGGNAPPTNPSDAYLTKVTYPQTSGVNHIVNYCYDYTKGLMLSSTDENNQTTTYAYSDALDRLTQTNYPDGGQITYAYNDAGPTPTETTTKKMNSSQSIVSVTTMNGLGVAVQTQLTSDPQGTVTTLTSLDGLGLAYKVYNPYRSGSDPTYGYATYVYDALGRTKSVTKPDGSVVSTTYSGNCTTVTDEAAKTRKSCTDGLGRLKQVFEDPSGLNWETDYGYDGLDDLTSVVQGGSRNRSFSYDSLKRMTQSNNPESGSISYGYDANGNVATKTDGRSITSTYSYDALNRVTGVTYSNGDHSLAYTYDQSACLGQSACYNIGRRTTMTDAGGAEYLAYDKMGRELVEQRTTNSVTKSATYTYDLEGDLATLTYPSGRTVTYTYDSAGRPSEAQDIANGVNYAYGSCANGLSSSGACYAPQGALSMIQNGANLVATYLYNTRLQPCWMYASTGTALAANAACTASDPGPGNILDLQYNFNLGHDNGDVLGITNKRNSLRTQTFTYDAVNRIATGYSTATYSTGSSVCWGETYTYDQWANLYANGVLSSSYNGCVQDPSFTVSPTTNNQFSGYSYDSSGNILNDGNAYAWNGESEIKTAAGVNYTYDGDGNRLQKSNGKLYWYGAGTEILDESDLSGNFTNEYVFFGGKRIAMRNVSTGVIYYYEEDMLGSSRTIVQAGQTSPCYDADFLPFGYEKAVTSTCAQNYKFEGKERDAETNNDDFGARYYSSHFGRWLSADWSSVPAPVPYANLTNPQTLNLYGMVGDNPESFADLDGHCGAPGSPSDNCGNTYTSTTGIKHPTAGACVNPGTSTCPSQTTAGAGNQQDQKDANQSAQGFWSRLGHGLSNLFHGHSWSYIKATVTVEQGPMHILPSEPIGYVTAGTDAAGVVAALSDYGKLGAASAVISLANDRSPQNIILTGAGFLPELSVPSSVIGAESDLLNFEVQTVGKGMINAIPADKIPDGNGHLIDSPNATAATNMCEALGGNGC